MKTCFYALLGVERAATQDELKKAYRRTALLHHPDKNPHQIDESTALFASIQEAYQVLSDPHVSHVRNFFITLYIFIIGVQWSTHPLIFDS